MAAKPKVLVVADCPHWVYARLAERLVAALQDEYAISWQPLGELVKPLPTARQPRYDIVVSLWWRGILEMQVRYAAAIVNVTDLFTPISSDFARDFPRALARANLVTFPTTHHRRVVRDHYAGLHWPETAVCADSVELDRFPVQPLPSVFAAGWAGTQWSRQLDGRPDNRGVKLIQEACHQAGVPLLIAEPHNGYIEWADMPHQFYRRISVYLCASQHDGGPNTILEAMASGRPVISTNVGLAPQLLHAKLGSGYLVDRDPVHFAEKLELLKVLGVRELATMGTAARQAVEPFGWDAQLVSWRTALLRARTHANL